MKSKKILMLELNEFNLELLKRASRDLSLSSIEKLLSLNEIKITTSDSYESEYLEPWSQWVSVHTGKKTSEHQIKHHGDIRELKFPQTWEVLAEKGITSGIWGAMNAKPGSSSPSAFFLPDLWTYSEKALPKELNAFLDLPRYMATHRLNLSFLKIIQLSLQFLRLISHPSILSELVIISPRFLLSFLRNPKSEFTYYCLFEYLSALLFFTYYKKNSPQFGVLFMNSLAHIQHYYWNDKKKLAYGLYFIDRIIKKSLQLLDLEQDQVILCNALSQKSTKDEETWIAYRPQDQEAFLKASGIDFKAIEPLMSIEAIVFFDDENQAKLARKILKKASINQTPLFKVENFPNNPHKLFYRVLYTEELTTNSHININDRILDFKTYFKKIIKRAGKHSQESSLFTNRDTTSKQMKNHEIHDYILNCFEK